MALMFLKSTTTLFLIFSALSIAIAFVVDTDGEPLRNGGRYYILPQNIGIGGGLSPKPETGIPSPCPYYIAPDQDETFPGIPVTITSPLYVAIITPGLPINIVFQDTKHSICMRPLGWKVIPDKTGRQIYVTTSGSGKPFDPSETFIIKESVDNEYTIKNDAFEGSVGIFENSEFLGITYVPLPVKFKKAKSDDGLAMKL